MPIGMGFEFGLGGRALKDVEQRRKVSAPRVSGPVVIAVRRALTHNANTYDTDYYSTATTLEETEISANMAGVGSRRIPPLERRRAGAHRPLRGSWEDAEGQGQPALEGQDPADRPARLRVRAGRESGRLASQGQALTQRRGPGTGARHLPEKHHDGGPPGTRARRPGWRSESVRTGKGNGPSQRPMVACEVSPFLRPVGLSPSPGPAPPGGPPPIPLTNYPRHERSTTTWADRMQRRTPWDPAETDCAREPGRSSERRPFRHEPQRRAWS